MFTSHKCIFFGLVLSLFLFTGCSKTTVTGTWKNSNYDGKPFGSIMVVGLTSNANNRLMWEDTMANKLRQNGLHTVVTSLKAFPNDNDLNEKEIVEHVKDKGIEGVLVTRVVDTKQEEVYHPPTTGVSFYNEPFGYYNHFNSYYSRAYTQVYSPGYTTTQTVVLLETNLYKSDTLELIWTMSSDTFDPKSTTQVIESVSKKVLSALKKDQLI
jgi:hypothetical protein